VPDDLARGVDGVDNGVSAAWRGAWGIDCREGASAVEETVVVAATVQIHAGDLSRGVDGSNVSIDAAWDIIVV
jgi:hypothetical protein